jgi:hypothetical protein
MIEPTHGTIQTKTNWSIFCTGVSKSDRASITVATMFSRTTNEKTTEAATMDILTPPNDKVERPGASPTTNEAD